MKKILSLFALPFLMFLVSCSNEASQEAESDAAEAAADEAVEVTESASSSRSAGFANKAVCLWNEAGLRDKPGRGKDVKWVAGISFGEVVTLTGNEEEVAADKRTYLEMTLSDGKTGWSNGYLYATNAQRAVATSDIDLYKRPELTTFTGEKFQRGDIFAVTESETAGWSEALGKERKKAGWMQDGSQFSIDEVDVTVAILIDRAMQEKDPRKREEALTQIASNSTFSKSGLISMVDDALAKVAKKTQLPANQLYIEATNLNVRSEPDNEADNVIFQLSEGDICNVLEKGERQAIREMDDYWYKVEKDGQEGWVYGHFTSKRLN